MPRNMSFMLTEEIIYPYIYVWGNNPRRAKLKGKRCRITARGKMNSVEIEFTDGHREITSGNALRKAR